MIKIEFSKNSPPLLPIEILRKIYSFKLTIPLLTISLILGMSLMSFTSYRLVRNLILQQLKENAVLHVDERAEKIDQWLDIHTHEVKAMANINTIRSLNWQVIYTLLQAEKKRFSDILSFSVGLPDGSYYHTDIPRGKSQKNIKDREYFQKGMAGLSTISDPFIGRVSKSAVIAITSPIKQTYDPASKTIGIVNIALSGKLVTQVVNSAKYGKNSYAFALNSQGVAIAHPNPVFISTPEKPAPTFLNANNPELAAIAHRMVNRQRGIELIPMDGSYKYIVYTPLKQVNWSVALVIPQENIESQLGTLNLLTSFLGGLIVIVVIAFIAVWRQVQLSEQSEIQVLLLNRQREILEKQAMELKETLNDLQIAQTELIQREKMSSLGRLVAGIAHEINNPISFIYSNIRCAEEYVQDLFLLLKLYQHFYPRPIPEIQSKSDEIELDFLIQDFPNLLASMQSGAERIKQIVLSLRNFSRLDEAEMKDVDIHEGINSTLLILESRFKETNKRPTIKVIQEYDDIPLVQCYAGKMNQVFMNIMSNAIDSIEGLFSNYNREFILTQPQINIKTELTTDRKVIIRIIDNGNGISENIKDQIFEPFFTTKPIGKGLGLGLSISYQIITEIHQGKLEFVSTPGLSTEFSIQIPLHQKT